MALLAYLVDICYVSLVCSDEAGPEVVNETAAQSMEKIPTYSPHIISGPNFFLAQTPCYRVEEIHLP